MKRPGLVLALTALTLASLWLWTPDVPRATLEARYLAAPTDLRRVGPWQLHVRDSGAPRAAPAARSDGPSASQTDAPAVVLLHGFGASLQTWDAWAEGLAATHRVVRIDLPGSGLSPPDPAHDYRDERSLQLLMALLDDLGLPRVSLVGHSMGGRIAWTFAAQFPERVDKLVLVAPDGYASFGFEYGKAMDVPASLSLMRHVLPKPLLRMNLKAAYARPESLTDPVTTRYHDLILAPGARQAMLDRLAQTVLQDPERCCAKSKRPLCWCGARPMP
jgi:pimeloyl-ACP methyl ester carboxylesterase